MKNQFKLELMTWLLNYDSEQHNILIHKRELYYSQYNHCIKDIFNFISYEIRVAAVHEFIKELDRFIMSYK